MAVSLPVYNIYFFGLEDVLAISDGHAFMLSSSLDLTARDFLLVFYNNDSSKMHRFL